MISAHSIFVTEKHPCSAILINYDADKYSQGYGQINETFRAFAKDAIV